MTAQNNTYPGVANAAAGAVNSTRGKKIVRMSCVAPAHPSWFLMKFINDILGGAAGYLNTSPVADTSTWDFDRYEPVLGHKRYTGGKCEGISVSYNAAGGPINVGMSWLAIYPAEEGSPATFAAPTRVTGRDYDTGDLSSTSLDLLRSFVWTAGRAQAPQPYANGTYYFGAISSHSLGGTLSIEQSPTASQGNQVAVAADTLVGTVVFQVGPSSTGVKFTNYVKRDSQRRASPGNAPGTEFWDYSLEDENNTSTTGYPFQIAAGS
ncbi:MAG TPA: hypothetical protein VNH18_28140 [Bryobacteraceae bacterium]|nr:hypothetical protein [Bryobacteraceae bacterium]